MVKITVLCDRCGQEINGNVGYIAWNFRDGVDGDLLLDNEFEKKHYCRGCMDGAKSFLCRGSGKEPDGTGDEPVPEPEAAGQKEQKGVKRIDIGKILALKDAGWGVGKIADEMGMKPAAVSSAIYNYRKKNKKNIED